MVGELLRCQRSQCPPLSFPPADSSLGVIHEERISRKALGAGGPIVGGDPGRGRVMEKLAVARWRQEDQEAGSVAPWSRAVLNPSR